jgi:succinate dehydrogenase / fumarate reductase cytochrome b subunit
MSTATSHAAAAQSGHSTFLRARLASVLAIVPLGVWTFFHLWNNLAAFRGPEAWQSAVTEYSHPISELIGFVIVLLPLVLHTIWGIGRLLTARPNNKAYNFYGNFKYALQRLTAIGVLAFLGAHIWLAFLQPRLLRGHPEAFADIAHEMHHHTPTLVVYLLGTLGVAYHLGNGVQTFCMGWGIVSSKGALKRLEWVAIGTFLVLLLMAWGSIYALWQAGAQMGA